LLRSLHGSLVGRVVTIASRELGWSSCYDRFTGAWLVELLQSLHGSLVGRVVKIVSRENG
jgi:hypothetical protein